MSGKNWSTTSSSSGGSTILSPSGNSVGSAVISAPWETSSYSLRDSNNKIIKDTWQDVMQTNLNNAMYAYNRSIQSFKENRDYNYNLYRENRDYNTLMNNTSISRMMEDMKRAGINPILAGRYGGFNWQNISAPFDYSTPYFQMPIMQMPNLDTNNYYGQDSQYFSVMLDSDTKMKLQDKQFKHDFEMLVKNTQADITKLGYDYLGKLNYLNKEYEYKGSYQKSEHSHQNDLQKNEQNFEREMTKIQNGFKSDLESLLKDLDIKQKDRSTIIDNVSNLIRQGIQTGAWYYAMKNVNGF